ncbi:MAG: hypothetical protein Q8N83_07045 [Ignavibacteria bacterium]|nr:hypothetical protein [Ignavibacteria bacterium]
MVKIRRGELRRMARIVNDLKKLTEWMNGNEWMNVFHSVMQPFYHPIDD